MVIPSGRCAKHTLSLGQAIHNSLADTVLALHEDPVIDEPYDMSIAESREYKDKCLGRIRANTLSVLSQLSKHGDEGYAHKPLSQSSVRKAMSDKHGRILRAHQKRSQDTGADPQHMAIKLDQKVKSLSVEGASNLFYYLFEDYAAAATFQAAEQTLGELVCRLRNSNRAASS